MKITHYNIKTAIQIIMICLCGILFLILIMQINNPPAITGTNSNNISDSVNTPPLQSEKTIVISEITHYDEIINRPIFHDDRKPYVLAELAKEDEAKIKTKKETISPKSKQQLSLTAIVISPETSMAILESEKVKTPQRIKLGESLEGWTLTEVQDQSVVLADGEETQILELEVKGSNKTQKSSSTSKTSEEKK